MVWAHAGSCGLGHPREATGTPWFHNPYLGIVPSKEMVRINRRTWLFWHVHRRSHLLTFISFAFY